MSRILACALALAACGRADAVDSKPTLAIVGESTRYRLGDPLPEVTPWFDGNRVTLVAARGETIGLQVVADHAPRLALPLDVHTFVVEAFDVTRPSTAGLYGKSAGTGRYADGLREGSPTSGVTYVEIRVPRDAHVGTIAGELVVGERRYPVELAIADVTIPTTAPHVWAYEDPREIAWASTSTASKSAAPSDEERACAAMFRDYGVLLSPDLHVDAWPARRASFDGVRDVPVVISDDPAKVGDDVRAWIAATKGTGHVPFAIPIDEPRTPERVQQVVALDQFIQLRPAANSGAWAYNGIPPYSGAMILDAETPGPRTWGWLMHRDGIAQWYVWDALYWHDRHNRKTTPISERALDLRDPVSFDDGEDHGNLDGVLALPGDGTCRPTLRLAALHRGQQDRALLVLANACDPMATARIVARTMPRGGWSTDESVWENSRRELIAIAACR
jgi:hypothetical protein